VACDIYLWTITPGETRSRQHVAMLTVRDVEFGGASVNGDNCLNIDISVTPNGDPITVRTQQGEEPAALTWLSLAARIWTTQIPRQPLGRVVIEEQGMPSLTGARCQASTWRWVIGASDVAVVERIRAMQPDSPLHLAVEVEGIVKVTHARSGQLVNVITLRGEASGLLLEMPKWDRLLKSLGYAVNGPAQAIADRATTEHPSWRAATLVTDMARAHYRNGEDYDALRDVLSGLEVLVTAPYNLASWKPLLEQLPKQKADGIAELLSGLATYCNKIGHHRDRERRDADGSLPAQPLDHWETDLIIGAAQFVLTYALRLRAAGLLTVPPPPAAKTTAPAPETPGGQAAGTTASEDAPV
jgi:hypothetical protein